MNRDKVEQCRLFFFFFWDSLLRAAALSTVVRGLPHNGLFGGGARLGGALPSSRDSAGPPVVTYIILIAARANVWRIDGKSYDLTKYIPHHPGGLGSAAGSRAHHGPRASADLAVPRGSDARVRLCGLRGRGRADRYPPRRLPSGAPHSPRARR